MSFHHQLTSKVYVLGKVTSACSCYELAKTSVSSFDMSVPWAVDHLLTEHCATWYLHPAAELAQLPKLGWSVA